MNEFVDLPVPLRTEDFSYRQSYRVSDGRIWAELDDKRTGGSATDNHGTEVAVQPV